MADDAIHVLRTGGVAVHQQVMALSTDPDAEKRFEVLEVLVVGAEERFDSCFGNGDAFQSSISLPCRHLAIDYTPLRL